MLIAASTTKTGRRLLILGLHEENITRLRDDQPIYKSLDEVPGLYGWNVTILGPEDMARFIAASGQGDEWTEYHEFRKRTDPPPWGLGLDAEPPPSTDAGGERG